MSRKLYMQKRKTNPLVLMSSPQAVVKYDRSDPAFIAGQQWAKISARVSLQTEVLVNVMKDVQTAYLAVQGLPTTSRDTQMNNLLEVMGRKQAVESALWDCIRLLGDAIEDVLHIDQQLKAEGLPEMNHDFERDLISIANQFRRAVREFRKSYAESDGQQNVMQVFDEVMVAYSDAGFDNHIQHMRDNAYKTGRKSGATPINKYILQWVKDDKNLHGGTDGDSYERFIRAHEKMPTVWQWIDNPQPKRLKKLAVEVQAYEAMRGLSRIEGRDRIQKIRQNG